MSEPESPELPIEEESGVVEEIVHPSAGQGSMVQSTEMSRELSLTLQQMRTQICALVLSFLIVSVALSLFVLKQNRTLNGSQQNRQQQIEQLKGSLELWMPALNELAAYSAANPELRAIFTRHGLQLGQQQPGGNNNRTP